MFMAAQNVVITLLIVTFGQGEGRALTQERKGKRGKVVLTGVAMAVVGYVLSDERVLPFSAREFLIERGGRRREGDGKSSSS